MTGPRTVRLSTLAAAIVILVLGVPLPASAACAAPTYHGGLPLRIGQCPETVAGGAAAGVWALLVLAAGLWLASALSRSRATTDSDLTAIDAVFGEATAEAPTPAEEHAEDSEKATPAPTSQEIGRQA